MTTKTKKPAAAKEWKCYECGHLMTLKTAQKAVCGPNGCPKCGGADIDLAPAKKAALVAKAETTPGMAAAIEEVAPGYLAKERP